MKLRVLIVEDEKPQREALKALLERLDADEREAAGIADVEVEMAACAAEARSLLEQTVAQGRPYDLMLLDLGLPEHPYEGDQPELGLGILQFAKQRQAVRGVIVVSVFRELERFVAPAFQLGATDFLGKPYKLEEVPPRFLAAWRRVKSDLLRAEQRQLRARAVLYADKSFHYRFGASLSRLIQAVRYETSTLRGLHTSEDTADTLKQSLAALETAVSQAKAEWQQLQAPFQSPEEASRNITVEQELARLAEELRPCLTIELTSDPLHTTQVLSFDDGTQDNVQLILREILIGGLSELSEPDEATSWRVTVNVVVEEGVAVLRFKDNFAPLDAELARQVTDGEIIAPRAGQWRAWGLSVVQHLALRGGGRLLVEPQADGNLITYRGTLAEP